jgi:hypothetical protein
VRASKPAAVIMIDAFKGYLFPLKATVSDYGLEQKHRVIQADE